MKKISLFAPVLFTFITTVVSAQSKGWIINNNNDTIQVNFKDRFETFQNLEGAFLNQVDYDLNGKDVSSSPLDLNGFIINSPTRNIYFDADDSKVIFLARINENKKAYYLILPINSVQSYLYKKIIIAGKGDRKELIFNDFVDLKTKLLELTNNCEKANAIVKKWENDIDLESVIKVVKEYDKCINY
ncbi:hypothetical protein [Paenimyroides baculatum]|uniref:DUF4468 domain-containing protein n=1 Tax=Paenimyroides baculatum TaxID=2608000 RepID=A0A5M6CCL2_9FLAO|nr:hypothetical protein [Paenimyroides baculatum]KAA5532866.1 hypothetical protein F0460_12525 [Paenimyroides baculatum]